MPIVLLNIQAQINKSFSFLIIHFEVIVNQVKICYFIIELQICLNKNKVILFKIISAIWKHYSN